MNAEDSSPLPVVYACRGCSDAGELADQIARQLARDGSARMSCLAGVGGRVKPLLHMAKTAECILVIDGCPLNRARHTLLNAGIARSGHLTPQGVGLRKGCCPVTEDNLLAGMRAAETLLQSPPRR